MAMNDLFDVPGQLDLDALTLTTGAHDSPDDGACVMEAVSWIAGEEWSDHPECVSPVLGAFARAWNDALDGETRQKLKPFAWRMIGTAGDGRDETRMWMAADWLVRTYTPAWLDLAGLGSHANRLHELAPIRDVESARATGPLLAAARAAARDAAAAAARDAARDAAWDAARDAARVAAWDAARVAAGDAARAAARDVLDETVRELQVSAFDLLDRMIDAKDAD